MKKIFGVFQKWFSDVLGTRQYFRYLEKEDRRRRLGGQFLTLITIVSGIYYLYWHWQNINWDAWYYSFFFFLAEAVGFLLFCFFSFNAWFLRYHAPEGIAVEQVFSVDVFIPVAGEPIDLLRETIEAAVRIDFKDKRIYILDDKNEEEYQELAEHYGCGYFNRPEHNDAKAGNLNYAFQRTHGDLILALDADQVPQPQIITKMIGYFKIPQIAFVQSKQDYKLPVGDPFGNADHIFYNVMQSGKDNDNAAFSCGSGVMYRRAALEEISGFSTWNIVEDVHTSMLLHDRGWRSIYHNYALTRGTAPVDIYSVYKQRKQWAADSIRILFWDNPFLRKGLTFKQKIQYTHLGIVYLIAAFVMPFFFITPVLSLMANKYILTAPVDQYVLHRSLYFIAMSLAYGLINYPTPYMKAFQMWTGLFPVFMQSTWIALRARKKKPVYRVNTKPVGRTYVERSWIAVLPQITIILSGFFTILGAFISGNVAWDFFLLNVLWISWSMWTMSGICFAALKEHRWPQEGVDEKRASSTFFARTRELFATILLTIVVTVFFTSVDATRINRFMNGFRLEVLRSIGFEELSISTNSEIPKGEDITEQKLESKETP